MKTRSARRAFPFLPLLILLLFPAVRGAAEVRVARVFTPHMVLQREAAVPVWGWAAPGEQVTVTFAGQKKEAVAAAADGAWKVELAPLKAAGEGRELVVAGATNTVTLADVVVGDVWLCSGQSNMVFTMGATRDAAAIRAANFPQIRFLTVKKTSAAQPAADLPEDQKGWTPVSPATAGGCSAAAFYFARRIHQETGLPIGLLVSAVGGTAIESWMPPEELKTAMADARVQADKARVPRLPAAGQRSGLFNGMILPLWPYAIKGALWYQGEANGMEGLGYQAKMEGLIGGWRKRWGAAFPFYHVQLVNFVMKKDFITDRTQEPEGDDSWARLREAQMKSLAIPHTGMAVGIDVGLAANIHPTNKFDLGERLARWALAKDYGKKELVYSGPLYKGMKVGGRRIRIEFEPHSVGSGLMAGKKEGLAPAVADPAGKLTRFAIAGADRKWVWAEAVIEGNAVVVSSPEVPNPVAVRYAFSMNPDGANLYNKEGLPASPFRTDEW